MPSPQQPNDDDCGIYALVVAWFLVAGREIPRELDAGLWRSVFLLLLRAKGPEAQLAGERALHGCLPGHLTNDVTIVDSPPSRPVLSGVPSVLQDVSGAFNTLLSWRQTLRSRAKAAEKARSCLHDQVRPLVEAWRDAIPAAGREFMARQDGLDDKVASLDRISAEAEALRVGLLATTSASVTEQVRAARSQVSKVQVFLNTYLGTMRDGQERWALLFNGLGYAAQRLTERVTDCRKHDAEAYAAISMAIAAQADLEPFDAT